MATQAEVKVFLNDFWAKYRTFDILFRDGRPKNSDTLLYLDIPPLKRREVIESITEYDYSEGPLDDPLYGIASMWVFGKKFKNEEIYIKISMGAPGARVICISFHVAERKMKYPFK